MGHCQTRLLHQQCALCCKALLQADPRTREHGKQPYTGSSQDCRDDSFTLDYYNKCVIQRIIDKYGMEPMEATRSFLTSQTHAMWEDAEYAMWDFSDIESPLATGNHAW